MENPEIELLLLLAVSLSPNSIKDIASASGIKASTIYKWKTTSANLSPKKMNALLRYFAEEEPLILTIAEIVEVVLIQLFTSTSVKDFLVCPTYAPSFCHQTDQLLVNVNARSTIGTPG